MKTLALVAIGLCLASLTPSAADAAFDPLTATPADYEVVASINSRMIIDSPLFQKVWPEARKPETESQLALLQGLTGVDLLKDIDRVSFFSRVNDDASVGVAFEGRIDEQRLLTLVKASGTYKTYARDGETVHEWFDKGENRAKFAVFPEPGVLIIWNSEAAMGASLAALADPTKALAKSPDSRTVPADAATLAGWAVLITRQETCPGAKLRVESAAMTMTIAQETMAMNCLVRPEPEFRSQWLDLAEGAKALALIQRDNPMLSDYAKGVQIASQDGNTAVAMTTTIDAATIIDLIKLSRNQ